MLIRQNLSLMVVGNLILLLTVNCVIAAEPDWQTLKQCRQSRGDTAYDDIMCHVIKIEHYGSKETDAHESTHEINSQLRNSHQGNPSFYCLKGRYVVLSEPRFPKSAIIRNIPQAFKTNIYQLYILNQEWTNALYPLDEFSAYINGSEAGMDLEDQGQQQPDNTACVKNAVFMSAYATAIVKTVDELDPSYKDKEQLRKFVGFGIERTLKLVERANRHPNFKARDLDSYVGEFHRSFGATNGKSENH